MMEIRAAAHACTLVTAVSAALLLAACGGGGGAKNVAACSLLTKQEVSSAAGIAVTAVDPVGQACRYTLGDPLDIIVVAASESGAQSQFEGEKLGIHLLGGKLGTPEAGDQSYWEIDAKIFYARKGDAYVGIDMRNAPVDAKTVAPALARIALTRL